jgi:DNA repair protein RadC
MTSSPLTFNLLRQDGSHEPPDSPLRRLLTHGAAPLSDAELVGLLLGSHDASQRAGRLLESFGTLEALLGEQPGVLEHHPAIGPRAAGKLLAAVELGRRMRRSREARPRLDSPEAIYRHLAPVLEGLRREVFHVLCFGPGNILLRNERVAEGSADQCQVDPREIFRVVFATRATAVVLAHTHPSGDPTPSTLDEALTAGLVQAASLLSVRILDHIIVGRGCYYSMRSAGRMPSCEHGVLPSAT